MTERPPKTPPWKQARWLAAAAVALASGYPASLGPAAYAVGRGWVGGWVLRPYDPLVPPEGASPADPRVLLNRYFTYAAELGNHHAAAAAVSRLPTR